MKKMEKRDFITIEGSKFIYKTNFSGDPTRDSFGSPVRKANLIIPDEELALQMIKDGYNVKQTKPREDDDEQNFVPKYFVSVKVNYNTDYPPKIYLVSGDSEPTLLTSQNISVLDYTYILNVDVVLNPYYSEQNNTWSLYIKTMYVTQDIEDDPFKSKYVQ